MPGLADLRNLGETPLPPSSLRPFFSLEACPEYAKGHFRAAPLWGFPKYFNDLVKKQPRALAPASFGRPAPRADLARARRAGLDAGSPGWGGELGRPGSWPTEGKISTGRAGAQETRPTRKGARRASWGPRLPPRLVPQHLVPLALAGCSGPGPSPSRRRPTPAPGLALRSPGRHTSGQRLTEEAQRDWRGRADRRPSRPPGPPPRADWPLRPSVAGRGRPPLSCRGSHVRLSSK